MVFHVRENKYSQIIEQEVKPTLESYFNTSLNKTKTFSLFDFISSDKTIYIELKQRNCKRTTYPTTMIGMNKINKSLELLKDNKSVKLVFKFTDGLYYYEFNGLSEECEIKSGGRCDRGYAEFKQYYFIPVEKLININTD
jgi:hypothetical protein